MANGACLHFVLKLYTYCISISGGHICSAPLMVQINQMAESPTKNML